MSFIRADPIIGSDTVKVGHSASGQHPFDAVVAVVADNQGPIARFGHAGGLEKSGGVAGVNVVRVEKVAFAMESSVGGNDTSVRINEQNAIAPGIANGQQAVLFESDALQGRAGSGDRRHNIADAT